MNYFDEFGVFLSPFLAKIEKLDEIDKISEKKCGRPTRMRVFSYTLALASKCEVADTPTGVVMKGMSGNSHGVRA